MGLFDTLKKVTAQVKGLEQMQENVTEPIFAKVHENLQKKVQANYDFHVGSVITFGSFPQGKNGEQKPINWLVLDITDNQALLITVDCLMRSGYCDPQKAYGNPWYLAWGNSVAREMCNGYFAKFLPAANYMPKSYTDRYPEMTCSDKVFLLSEEEVRRFLPDENMRRALVSDYLLSQGEKAATAYEDTKKFASWWILPHEESNSNASYPQAVLFNGQIQYHGRNIMHTDFTIRPCVRVEINQKFLDLLQKEKEANAPEVKLQILPAENKDNKNIKGIQDTGYFKFAGGIIFKLNADKTMLYRFHPTEKVWVKDPEMLMDYAYVNIPYESIEFEDVYPIKEE